MPNTFRVIWTLTRRELAVKLSSFWLYGLMSAICLVAALFGGAFIQSFDTENVLVSSGPISALNAGIVLFLGLALGIRLTASLVWEREHRTLDVLLAGPTGHSEIIAAKFIAELLVLMLILVIYLLFLIVGQPLGSAVLTLADAGEIAIWSSFIIPVMAFGLLVSALFSSVRAAVVAFLVVITFLGIYEGLVIWLAPLSPTDMSLSMLYLRSGLESVQKATQWLSPVSHICEPVLVYLGRSVSGWTDILAAVTLGVSFLGISVAVSARRGIV